jgi:alcohol dehydrogenase (cytochrome c)
VRFPIRTARGLLIALATVPLLIVRLGGQQRRSASGSDGEHLYMSNCVGCHGIEGGRVPGIDFRRGQFRRVTDDNDLRRVITQGIPGTPMPPTTPTEAQAAALSAYVRTLRTNDAHREESPAIVHGVAALRAPVTAERLIAAVHEPENWLTYSGTYASQRYSTLAAITPANVKDVALEWMLQLRSLEKFEATPLVVDGVMYFTQPPNDVMAVDAATGRLIWSMPYHPSPAARLCCGNVNRGLAMLGTTLFMATTDAHLLALDARDGRVIWNIQVADAAQGYSMTLAPLAIKDKVLVGTAGGEYGIRGFIAAYDAATGHQVWRFHTVPGPGEPGNDTWAGDSWQHGAASVWVTGSYDPALNLTYWGTGNPGPDYNDDVRAGANLYSNSVVALDPATGKLKWHFQFTPHDEFDYDSTQIPVLADMDWQGHPRKLILWANRNGFFYVLDRVTGEFLLGKPFISQTWASGLDSSGHPVRIPGARPSPEGTKIYPGVLGGINWYSPSYSPRTGMFYIPAWVNYYSNFVRFPIEFSPGQRYTGGTPRPPARRGTSGESQQEDGYGAIRAIDPRTGDKRWEFRMTGYTTSGVLTTASNLLFTGGREGYFYALEARTGALLWKASVGGEVAAGPMTYQVGAKQYVAIAAGHAMFSFALRERR